MSDQMALDGLDVSPGARRFHEWMRVIHGPAYRDSVNPRVLWLRAVAAAIDTGQPIPEAPRTPTGRPWMTAHNQAQTVARIMNQEDPA